nr:tetraacyldisaccharide 4'-kinase [Pseudopedobacter sp.]
MVKFTNLKGFNLIQILRWLLLPFSLIYSLIIACRNWLYDYGIFKSQSFTIPIISVGNLEVGGSGKTPMVEYLIRLLKDDFKLSTLSRGYGRKTKGFRWVKPDDDATQSGDEPLQIKQNFKDISVTVCEDRVFGVHEIQKNHQLILMDDAFQHRAVKPGLNILLFDYHQLKKLKIMLPTGNYRESFAERKRAQIIIISKCPADLNQSKQEKIIQSLSLTPDQKVFFSNVHYYQKLKGVFDNSDYKLDVGDTQMQVLLITGIAKTKPFLHQIKKYTSHITHHCYPDHHIFSTKNMLKLAQDFDALPGDHKIIITTQKDAVRLRSVEISENIKNLPIYAWPIAVDFMANGKTEFDKIIKEYAQSNQRIS